MYLRAEGVFEVHVFFSLRGRRRVTLALAFWIVVMVLVESRGRDASSARAASEYSMAAHWRV